MAWNLQGDWIESCSCQQVCVCNFGTEGKPDQGWCSAAVGLNIRQGNSDGVDLSNVRAVLVADFPGNFGLGNGTARFYFDEGMNQDQRTALEAILSGQKGGVWEGLAGAMSKLLPTKVARITLDAGENPSIRVADAGETTFQRIKDEQGRQSQLVNSPVGTAFGIPVQDLATSTGRWTDSEMRSWQAGGAGAVVAFNWRV